MAGVAAAVEAFGGGANMLAGKMLAIQSAAA